MKKFTRTMYQLTYLTKAYNPATDVIEEAEAVIYVPDINEEPNWEGQPIKVLKAELIKAHSVQMSISVEEFIKAVQEHGRITIRKELGVIN